MKFVCMVTAVTEYSIYVSISSICAFQLLKNDDNKHVKIGDIVTVKIKFPKMNENVYR